MEFLLALGQAFSFLGIAYGAYLCLRYSEIVTAAPPRVEIRRAASVRLEAQI